MNNSTFRLSFLKTLGLSSLMMMAVLLSFSFINKRDATGSSFENKSEVFLPALSGYNIYEGNLMDLTPAKGVELYELTSHLFVDYAEKQRLIKLPAGTKMTCKGSGLPDFPDGTIIVKTLYWYKDKRNPSVGRNIVETRLLIKNKTKWNVGTYKWNAQQNEALLISTGADVNVKWKDLNGIEKDILFHIPSNTECSKCHQSNKADLPIGPKLRNLNFDVFRNGTELNQLIYFKGIGWLDTVNLASVSSLPNYENADYSLEKRARAYLDMNCAHCHSSKAPASNKKLRLEFETPLDETEIVRNKTKILKRMLSNNDDSKMPSIGTSVIDAEGFELIKQYMNSID